LSHMDPSLGHFVPDAPIVPDGVNPAGPLAAQAQQAWEEIVEARRQLADVDRRHGEAQVKVREAHAALHAQAANPGYDADAEAELSAAHKEALRLADPGLHTTRRNAARARALRAVGDYVGFVRAHAPALVDELRPEAEAATAALIEALAELEPVRERYRSARASVAAVTEHLVGPSDMTPDDLRITLDEREVPIPARFASRALEPVGATDANWQL
jgi:hypothetical protein